MTPVFWVACVFLVVSAENLAVQAYALHKLLSWPPRSTRLQTQIFQGLLRTSLCRVTAGAVYTVLGSTALAGVNSVIWPLVVFTGVQIMWQINAIADVRLRRQIQREGGDTISAHTV